MIRKIKIIGLLQARMGSSRLPGKVMKTIMGVPLSGHIIDRLLATRHVTQVIVATSIDHRNDPLVEYARSRGVEVYRSPCEDDIAERLYFSARMTGADAILKVNGDCPLVDPVIMSNMTELFLANAETDYISNKMEMTWPEGMSAEIITFRALEWCHENLEDEKDRELVASWIMSHPDRFPQITLKNDGDNPLQHKLSVDTPEDYQYVLKIFEKFYEGNRYFGFKDLLESGACWQD